MSMNRYANAGPIMAGLAAMSEPLDALYIEPPIEADDWGDIDPAPMMLDVWRGIQNLADQLSEVAAQMVDIRKRLDALDALEGQKRQPHGAPYGGIPSGLFQVQPTGHCMNVSAPYVDALQAQQAAAGLKGPSAT